MFKYTQYGNTVDSNGYPVLSDDGSGDWIVGLPVDDYIAVNKHFNDLDEKLSAMEKKLGIEPDDGLCDCDRCECEGKRIQSGREAMASLDWMDAMFTRKPELPDYASFETIKCEPYVKIKTYLHTIINGEHQEMLYREEIYIGNKPSELLQPEHESILTMSPAEIDEYVQEVVAWQTREKDIKDYYEMRDIKIDQAKDIMTVCIEGQIKTGRLFVANHLYQLSEYTINPFAVWIAPEKDIPNKFAYMLSDDVNGMGGL